ncbi:hypothetical protein CBL_08048 [Carabus blaptoides fortunei]
MGRQPETLCVLNRECITQLINEFVTDRARDYRSYSETVLRWTSLIKDELSIPVMTVFEGDVVGMDAEEDISTRISLRLDTFSMSEISTLVLSSWSASFTPFPTKPRRKIVKLFIFIRLCSLP